MLVNLLKYDLKSTFRLPIIVYPLAIIFALVSGLQFKSNFEGRGGDVFLIVSTLLFTVMIVAVSIVTLVAIISHFKNNIFGHEGYLTNTLPVTTHEIIISKLIAAVTVQFVTFCVVMLSFLVFINSAGGGITVKEIVQVIIEILRDFNLSDGTALIINGAGTAILSVLAIYAAIALGHTFNNHKNGISILVYLGLMTVRGMVNGVVSSLLDVDFLTANITMLLFVECAITLACCAFCYILTNAIISTKLNLE